MPCKIASYQLNLERLLDLQDDEGLNLRRIEAGFRPCSSSEEGESRPRARRRFFNHAERWLRFLGWLEEPEATGLSPAREVADFAARMCGGVALRLRRAMVA